MSPPRARSALRWAAVLVACALIVVAAVEYFPQFGERRPKAGEAALSGVQSVGALTDDKQHETSGVAAPRSTPGLLWSLDDSGNDAELFRFTATGESKGRVRIDGADNRDWEALSAGPCPEGECLYIGDVGDNDAKHPWVRIYRVAITAAADTATHLPIAASMLVRYDDGARDVEAMFVAPDTSVWFLSKRPERDKGRERWRPARLWRLPAAAWTMGSVTVQRIDSLPIVPDRETSRGWVTDASLGQAAGGGMRLAVLTYGAVWVFEADPLTGWPGRQVGRCALSRMSGRYAEAVTWLPDGQLLILAEGAHARLVTGRCP